jgi:hypothetical protein
MFASLKSLDSDLGVPMVRCDDADDFDLFVVEDFAIVFDRLGLALTDSIVVACSFAMIRIDIAHGDDVAEAVVVMSITGTHPSHSDATDFHSILSRCGLGLG